MAASHDGSHPRENSQVTVTHRKLAPVLALAALALPACGSTVETAETAPAEGTAGRLVLSVQAADTAADGRRCILDVTVRNDTGLAAANVQAAWMARTDGFGSISDYQVLGDFAVGEARALQLAIFGAPCEAVREITLSRAVCTVDAAEGPPQSCADLVMMRDEAGFATRR